MNSFNHFDIIKAHLLDEGYANDEKSAIAIMANMSENWKQSILEMDASAIAAREKYRDSVNNSIAAGTRGPAELMRKQAAQQREKNYNNWEKNRSWKAPTGYRGLAGVGKK